jgi:hypothetical protein
MMNVLRAATHRPAIAPIGLVVALAGFACGVPLGAMDARSDEDAAQMSVDARGTDGNAVDGQARDATEGVVAWSGSHR